RAHFGTEREASGFEILTKSRSPRTALASAMSRRRFIQACGACVSAVTALVSGCVSIFRPGDSTEVAPPLNCAAPGDGDAFDYIVVGYGAGGGPLAANLALGGFRVLPLEAGGSSEGFDYHV